MADMSVWDKVANSQPTRGGNFLRDGIYRLAVRELKVTKGFKGHCFIAEFLVLESKPDLNVPDTQPNAPGTVGSFVVNLDKFESAAGNVKAFILALLGSNDVSGKEFAEAMQALCGDQQPARGMLVDDSTYRKTTQKGNPFTVHNWAHVAGQSQESVAAMRLRIEEGIVEEEVVEEEPAPPPVVTPPPSNNKPLLSFLKQ